MIIRQVTDADVGQLRALARETFLDTFRGSTSDEDMQHYLDTAYAEDTLLRELADPESEVYFAEVEGAPAAYLKLNVGSAQSEPMPEDHAEIQRIYVAAGYQGQGLGAGLMEHAIGWARERGKSRLWLGVWEHNHTALSFYRRFGFTRIGEHSFVTGATVFEDWVLAKDLDAR